MKLISFDALRTLHLPAVHYLKPEQLFEYRDRIAAADWVLFPEYWQLPPLLYSLQARIFPSPASYQIGHSKTETTRTFQALAPEHLPFTLIEANTPENAERVWARMPLPFVAKIPRSSMGQGVFLIEYNRLFGNTGLRGCQPQIDQALLTYLSGAAQQDDPDPTHTEQVVG